jgi:hypothetical protein
MKPPIHLTWFQVHGSLFIFTLKQTLYNENRKQWPIYNEVDCSCMCVVCRKALENTALLTEYRVLYIIELKSSHCLIKYLAFWQYYKSSNITRVAGGKIAFVLSATRFSCWICGYSGLYIFWLPMTIFSCLVKFLPLTCRILSVFKWNRWLFVTILCQSHSRVQFVAIRDNLWKFLTICSYSWLCSSQFVSISRTIFICGYSEQFVAIYLIQFVAIRDNLWQFLIIYSNIYCTINGYSSQFVSISRTICGYSW